MGVHALGWTRLPKLRTGQLQPLCQQDQILSVNHPLCATSNSLDGVGCGDSGLKGEVTAEGCQELGLHALQGHSVVTPEGLGTHWWSPSHWQGCQLRDPHASGPDIPK